MSRTPLTNPWSFSATSEPERIGERWVVDHEIGRGGMGKVLACHAVDDPQRLVAVKVPDLVIGQSGRFRREAEVLLGLDHTGIVRFIGQGMDGASPYLVMELLEGRPLCELVLEPTQALEVIAQVADALAYMHERGVSHRDLKPGNVLLTTDGPKLIDFGLAMQDGSQAITGHDVRVGTAAYAPPEWLFPSRIDPMGWDRYALGVLAFELLAACPAFPVDPDLAHLEAAMVIMARKRDLDGLDLGPDVPPALRALVRKLTHWDPEQRPASTPGIAHAFREIHDASGGTFDRPDGVTFTSANPDTWIGTVGGAAPRAQPGFAPAVVWVLVGAVAGLSIALLAVTTALVWVLLAG